MADTFQAVVVATGSLAEGAGARAGQRIEEAGQMVTDRHNTSGADAVRQVSALCAAGQIDLVVVAAADVSVFAQVGTLLQATLPVLTSAYGVRRFHQAGGNALGEGFVAGVLQSTLVLVLPAAEDAVDLAMDLVLPALPALLGTETVSVAATPDIEELIAEPVDEQAEEAPEPDHVVEQGGMSLGSSEMRGPSLDAAVPGEEASPGWQRWLKDHDATVLTGRREELPNAIDELAPVLQILHTCGEQAVVKIGRNKMSLWGWPDLQRPTSKVVAVGWGLPYVEVVALHRHPVNTGLAIEEERALVHRRDVDLETLSKELTGRRIKNPEGALFASEKGRIWVERNEMVYEWDGKKETNIGTRNQALASLLLSWSQR